MVLPDTVNVSLVASDQIKMMPVVFLSWGPASVPSAMSTLLGPMASSVWSPKC